MQKPNRRVFYCEEAIYRIAKSTSALMGETLSEFIATSIQQRLDRESAKP